MENIENVGFGMSGGLTPDQIRRIHGTALRVLDEIGCEVRNDTLRRGLAGQAGVRLDGTRVRLAPDLVERLLTEHRAALPPVQPPGGEFLTEVLSGYSFEFVDPASGRLRPMQTADCIRFAGLVDGLYDEGLRGGTPGLPQDVAPALREVLAYKISLEHTRCPGWPGFTSRANGDAVLRMAEAAGQRIGISVFVLDPLLVEGPTIDMAVEFLQRKAKMTLSISCMPMPGATSPFPLPAAMVECVATNLAAFTAFKCLGMDIGINPQLFPFDMRFGAIAMGTPEHVISWLMANQLSAFYNRGHQLWFCPAFQTNAVYPDAHSLTTRTAFATVGALNGIRHFGYAGLLGIDKIFSDEQLILDLEIVRYLRHLVQPVAFSDETLGFEILKEAGPGGSFFTHPSTVAGCHAQWASPLFLNQSPEQAADRSPAWIKEQMQARIRRAESAHEVRLDAATVRELDRIFRDYVAAVR